MEYLIVYLLVVLGSAAYGALIFPTLVVLGLAGIFAVCHDEENKTRIKDGVLDPYLPTYRLIANKLIKVLVIPCLLLSIFIPSKTDLMWIIGLGTGWKVIQNEQVQALPPKLVEFLNKQLEEQTK